MEPEDILEKINNKTKRRSTVLWSSSSITGYVWDILKNLIVVGIILTVYSIIYDPSDVIIVSILILVYIHVVSMGAQLGQGIARIHLQTHSNFNNILRRLGKEDDGEENELEDAEFIVEKGQYKNIINSVFNFVIFLIAVCEIISTF